MNTADAFLERMHTEAKQEVRHLLRSGAIDPKNSFRQAKILAIAALYRVIDNYKQKDDLWEIKNLEEV